MSKTCKNRIIVLSLIAFAMVCVFLISKLDIKRYGETCSNPPSEFWIEEDLEMVFLTTQVNVLEMDDYDGDLIVKIRLYDEGAYRTYRCLYKVKRIWIGVFEWKFERYV